MPSELIRATGGHVEEGRGVFLAEGTACAEKSRGERSGLFLEM